MKKIIALVLVFTLMFNISIQATEIQGETSKLNIVSEKTTYDDFESYQLNLSTDKKIKTDYMTLESMITDRSATESVEMNGLIIKKMETKPLNILNDKYVINSFEKIDNSYYLDYNINDNMRIIAEYHDDGSKGLSIYDINKDMLTIIGTGSKEAKVIYNVKEAKVISLDEEKIEAIDKAYEENDFDALDKIEGIEVTSNNDTTIVKPIIDQSGFISQTNEGSSRSSYRDITPSVYSEFPSYSNKYMYSGYKYCSGLGKTVRVTVKDSKTSYKQIKYSYMDYGIGTSLTTIGFFLGVGPSVVATLLTIASVTYIVYGGVESIMENIVLANDAKYEYLGKRNGYVYDTTVYNDTVKVKWNEKKGQFDGGYLSNGEWAWIESPRSAAFNYSVSYIANKALSLYNADIITHGGCLSYYPE